MKRCSLCGESKPFERFTKNKNPAKGAYSSWCKPCAAAKQSARRRAERDADIVAWRNKSRIDRRRQRHRRRAKALALLGGACARCGFEDTRALQIDHVAGGGNQEHKRIGSWRIADRVAQGAPGYQLLCANCNWIKRAENKEHVQPKGDD